MFTYEEKTKGLNKKKKQKLHKKLIMRVICICRYLYHQNAEQIHYAGLSTDNKYFQNVANPKYVGMPITNGENVSSQN
jgi:hypothetical protein